MQYLYRPSRTLQFQNEQLKQSLNTEKGPETKIGDGEKVRTVRIDKKEKKEHNKSESSELSSSESQSSSVTTSSLEEEDEAI